MITSNNNELIKKCLQIKQKKYSREYGLCLVESIKLVKELTAKNLITTILVVEDKFNFIKNYSNVKIEVISNSVAKYISDAVTTDGVFGICKIPNAHNYDFNKVIILDRIQDPANMGAIIRSACAFGFKTILSVDSVYPYSFKTIRSSMGNIFNVDFIDITFDNLLDIKRKYAIKFYCADMHGEIIDNVKVDKNENRAIVIGSEGQGVHQEFFDIADNWVSIPMQNDVESLNASVSASIIMYLLK